MHFSPVLCYPLQEDLTLTHLRLMKNFFFFFKFFKKYHKKLFSQIDMDIWDLYGLVSHVSKGEGLKFIVTDVLIKCK